MVKMKILKENNNLGEWVSLRNGLFITSIEEYCSKIQVEEVNGDS